jgi:hypothetical protein
MKRLAVLAVVVLGAVASVTAAQAGNTTITNTSTPISGTEFVPCAAGGAGELVDVSGSIHEVIRTTINGNNVSMTFHENFQGLKGVGETTGDTYVGNGEENVSQTASLNNGQANFTGQEHININGQGSAPNFSLNVIEHTTVNANGDVTVFFDNFSVDCG